LFGTQIYLREEKNSRKRETGEGRDKERRENAPYKGFSYQLVLVLYATKIKNKKR
jgi:hypothetical protein